MKSINCTRSLVWLLAGFLLLSFTKVHSNSLLDCCGLLLGAKFNNQNTQGKTFNPSPSSPQGPRSQKHNTNLTNPNLRPRGKVFTPVKPNPMPPPQRKAVAPVRPVPTPRPERKMVTPVRPNLTPRPERKVVTPVRPNPREIKPTTGPTIAQLAMQKKAFIECMGKRQGKTVTSSIAQQSSPAMFYYAPRMKSIRVSSPPNIDGWERSLREEMRLNGRSRHTVDRLLARIQKYYDDPSITAADYAPGNEGYQPSKATRELAESRIKRSVESMAEFFKKSGNPSMDSGKSSNGSDMMKGKLAFINTQLDKLGKERVGMEDLREIVGLTLNPPAPIVEEKPKNEEVIELKPEFPLPEIAGLLPEVKADIPALDLAAIEPAVEVIVEDKVEELYLKFASWLADNKKNFPSLDPEVDGESIRVFDLINEELRELGKFENMEVFREKTLAHLDEIMDDRGQMPVPVENIPGLGNPILPAEDDPLFRGTTPRVHSYVHLASLPGKVVTFSNSSLPAELPGKRAQFDDNGNRRIFRILDNLPGKVID
jgi:hypothetical protein